MKEIEKEGLGDEDLSAQEASTIVSIKGMIKVVELFFFKLRLWLQSRPFAVCNV